MLHRFLSIRLVPLLAVAACSEDPPAPADVRARIAGDLGHVLREGAAAGRGGVDAIHLDAAFGLFERFAGNATEVVAAKRGGTVRGGVLDRAVSGVQRLVPIGSELDGDAIVEQLTTKIFTDENHLGDGIYRVPASLVCTDDGVLDAECARDFDAIELRIRTATEDDRLIFGVQVGADHDEPVRFTLSHTSLAITIDLDEAGQATASLAPLFGNDPPNARMSGAVTGQLDILGPAHAKLSLTFNRPIEIAVAEPGISLDGPDAFRFTSAAANVTALVFDAKGGTGSIIVDLGATTAHLPAEEGATDLDLGGVSMIAMLATDQPMQLTHVSLGERTTTLSVGGRRAVTIDLNPDDGRAFGATITHDAATGIDTIAVTPKLDLRTAIDHAVLGDEPPLFDVTRVVLEGSLRTAGNDQIQVASGTFAITTNPAQFGFVATAGQCLTETIDAWAVGACP